MNELRMHVERLFEGRVPTQENIDLKEEIYANLVARYEDYVKDGMSESAAIERTKASLTSIDDVLGENVDASAASDAATAAAPVVEAASAVQAETVAAAETTPMDPAPTAPTQEMPVAAAAYAAPAAEQSGAVAFVKKYKVPLIVAAVVVIVLLIAGVANAIYTGATAISDDAYQAQNTQATTSTNSDSSDSSASTSGTSTSTSPSSDVTTLFPDDDRNAATQELNTAIIGVAASSLYTVAASDTAAVQGLLASLPLNGNLASVTSGSGTVDVTYSNIADAVDGDAIERAVALNVVTLFAASSELNTITMTVQENDDDGTTDTERYTFQRANVETALANAGLISGSLTSNVFADDSTWASFRDGLVTSERNVERIIDAAEHN